MRTYRTTRVTTVDYTPSSEPLPPARRARQKRSGAGLAQKPQPAFRGFLDLIDEGQGMCSLDAMLPVDIGRALVAVFNARVKAQ